MDVIHASLVVAVVALAGNAWLLWLRVAKLERARRVEDVAFAIPASTRARLLTFLEQATQAAGPPAAPPAHLSQGDSAR